MRKWTVDGQDETTGEQRRLAIEAQDEQGAAEVAAMRGVIATAVYIFDAGAERDYRREELRRAAALESETRGLNPHLDAINGANRRLQAADFVLSMMGGLYILVGLISGGIAAKDNAGMALLYFISGVAAGVSFLGMGAALRMLGLIGISTATPRPSSEGK